MLEQIATGMKALRYFSEYGFFYYINISFKI